MRLHSWGSSRDVIISKKLVDFRKRWDSGNNHIPLKTTFGIASDKSDDIAKVMNNAYVDEHIE